MTQGLPAARARWRAVGGLVFGVAAVVAAVAVLNLRDESPAGGARMVATAAQVARGAYLARAGNCAGCHTERGGAAYAGGTGIATPFGTVYAGNLTPDPTTGLGAWDADAFWRAIHNGRSRDGRLLYPAFPYPNFTRVTRDDADALFAYLQSLPAVARPNTPHALRWPYRLEPALAVWRALYFRPGVETVDASRPPDWNRGRYLVEGLGHCGACHSARNALGAVVGTLGGGLIPVQNWYAPALDAAEEAGVADWPVGEVVELLKTGRTDRAAVAGPMADVVYRSTQHLNDADLAAVAVYLKSLPPRPSPRSGPVAIDPALGARGQALYGRHCAGCHGDEGQGAPGAYPALAGNRAVALASPANLVKIVVGGGYLPATAGNPRPFGMPPFGAVLDDTEIAAVLTYVRSAWGLHAAPVSALDVLQLR